MIRIALAICAAGPAFSDIAFMDRSAGLPTEHIYAGGWTHFVGGGVAILDCNNDAKPDLYVAGGENPARLFVNTTPAAGAAITFSDVTSAETMNVTGAYPIDINGDTFLDLVVLRVGQNLLLQGNGACGFTDFGSSLGFSSDDRWTTAFTATWEGRNHRPTLIFGNYVDRDDPEGPFEACDVNVLYRPDNAWQYAAPQPLEPGFCALSMLASDWRRTGTAELRISNDRHYYVRGGHEEMWQLSPLRPLGPEDGWQNISLWGMGIASGDISQNGFPDVMLTSMGDQVLMFNDGSGFAAAPFAQGAAAQRPHIGDDGRPSTGWHAEFADVNNDGRLDLFIAKGNVDQMPSNALEDPNNLLIQQPDGRFKEASIAAGIATVSRSRGAGLADFDGDGLLDLVVVNRRAPLEIWQNVSTSTGNWARIAVSADGPNTQGVGAWVELRTKEGVQAREITVGGGHVSGQSGPLHFGLGPAKVFDLRIKWPGMDWSGWSTHDSNQTINLHRNH